MRIWAEIFLMIGIQQFVFSGEVEPVNLRNCAFYENKRVFSSNLSNAKYLPQISLSYRYQPKQKYPNITNKLLADFFPNDMLRENDDTNSVVQNLLKGERHGFWIGLRWDFDEFVFAREHQSLLEMNRQKAKKRMQKLREEYAQPSMIPHDASQEEKIAYMSKQETLAAKLHYFCSRN